MIDWSDIEDALHSWVRTASGLEDSRVLFSDQNASVPSSGSFIIIRLGDLFTTGGPDAVVWSTDIGQVGQEVEMTAKGPREFTVSVQAFTGDTHGDLQARSLLDKVQSHLGLPTVRDALNNAGLGVLDTGQVRNLSALAGTDFEGRASLDVRFFVMQTASERVGYISTVELVDLTGNDVMELP